ncbi:hypothetical protein [Campylobacter concisus]|nr:hypothetical protein [Campylobacter concisus]
MPKTIHYSGNTLLPKPFALSIVKYSDNEGYYLLYLDKFGEEQADTYHETLEDAIVNYDAIKSVFVDKDKK